MATATATHSAGPRFFHFVIGGVTPAALAADWVASLLDQNAGFRASSLLAAELERTALRWLRELFGLPEGYGGALVASATFANSDLVARWELAEHLVDALREFGILYDRGADGGEFFQLYTDLIGDRFFIEVVQRAGGYSGYGAVGAATRMAAQR